MKSPELTASSSLVGSLDERTGFSDDEMDWEEIEVPDDHQEQGTENNGAFNFESEAGPSNAGPSTPALVPDIGHIEITIKRGKTVDEARKYATSF